MTQPALAHLINAPDSTMKALEAGERGTRGLSPAILEKIRFATGAVWDTQKKRWLFDRFLLAGTVDPEDRFVPLTRNLFLEYRRIFAGPVANPEEDLVLMRAWLDELFKAVSAERWMALHQRYAFFIEECCRDFGLGDAGDLFMRAAAQSQAILDSMIQQWAERLRGKPPKEILSELRRRVLPALERANIHFGGEVKAVREIYQKLESQGSG
jgi:hypothetical protein